MISPYCILGRYEKMHEIQCCWEFHNCPKKEKCYAFTSELGDCCFLTRGKVNKETFAFDKYCSCTNCHFYQSLVRNNLKCIK